MLSTLILAVSFTAPSVVELFTSQGCSSCPAADALVNELGEARRDLVTLSLHVDYWDGLGWPDPYASPEATARQRVYGAKLDGGRVYTPEVVVDGERTCVGSDRACIETALSHARPKVALTLLRSPDGVELVGGPPPNAASLVVAWLERLVSNDVPRGENAGRTLTHRWVVRKLVPHADARVHLPVPTLSGAHLDRVVVLAQAPDLRVLGVGVLDL